MGLGTLRQEESLDNLAERSAVETTAIIRQPWTREEGEERATRLFQEAFGEEPAGVWSAPGRVNLIGEHTDYNGGLALPIALPHRTYVAAKPRVDRLVRLVSAQESSARTVNLDEVGPVGSENQVDGWPAYVVGVAWAMEQSGNQLGGFDIAVDSCVPYGAGLSSSAALSSSVGVALADLFQIDADREQLVSWGVQAENQVAGAPTGGMDQAASLRCQRGHAILLDSRDHSLNHIAFDLNSAGLKLLVIDTKAEHSLVDGQYAQRRATCQEATETLGIQYLADVENLDAALAALPDPVSQRRVRHVVTEIARTRRVANLLQRDPDVSAVIGEVGALFTQSHISLQEDYEVSCAELDVAVETSLAHGALGARMTGGGFGGSAIALVPNPKVVDVIEAVRTAFADSGLSEPEFLVVEADEPAGRDR